MKFGTLHIKMLDGKAREQKIKVPSATHGIEV
jgi:hypothetical protein